MPESVLVPVRLVIVMGVRAGMSTLAANDTVKVLSSGSPIVLNLDVCVMEAVVIAAVSSQTLSHW